MESSIGNNLNKAMKSLTLVMGGLNEEMEKAKGDLPEEEIKELEKVIKEADLDGEVEKLINAYKSGDIDNFNI